MEHPYLNLSPDGKTVNYIEIEIKEEIQEVVIPDSVTEIASEAISGCRALQSIDIPDSVTTIGMAVFYGCRALQSITVSPGNKNYCSEAGILYDKQKHTLIKYPAGKQETIFVIPDSVTTIGGGAFEGCRALQSIGIPDSVSTIGNGAFEYCNALQSIVIPDSVTEIGVNAFSDCRALQSITVSPGNKNYCSEAGILYDKQKHTLIKYPAGKQETIFVIPDSVTTIEYCAFRDCSALQSVDIPESVAIIEEYAFSYCRALQSIDIPDSVTTIGYCAFYNCSALQSIDIPDSVTDIGGYAFGYCRALQSVDIPNSVTTIGDGAFYVCRALQSIDIPDSVTEIGIEAFEGCSELQSIYMRIKKLEDISYINDEGFIENLDNPSQIIFDKSIFETCTLFVPPGTQWKYRHHPYFAQFKKIEIIS